MEQLNVQDIGKRKSVVMSSIQNKNREYPGIQEHIVVIGGSCPKAHQNGCDMRENISQSI